VAGRDKLLRSNGAGGEASEAAAKLSVGGHGEARSDGGGGEGWASDVESQAAADLYSNGGAEEAWSSDAATEARSDSSGEAWASEAAEAACGGETESSDITAEVAKLLTPSHIRFYQRYGFVVVQGAVPAAQTQALSSELKGHLWEQHKIDLDDLNETLTMNRLSAAFSPDGSGMVEMYWLPAMEAVRQDPRLHEITLQLFSATWGAAARGFKLDRRGGAPAARPTLGLYIDRTSLRLPACAMRHLVSQSRRKTGFKIKIPVPFGYRLEAEGGGPKLLPGEYLVKSVKDVKRVAGGKRYLVEWEGYPGADTWEPRENLGPVLIAEFEARQADGSSAAADTSLEAGGSQIAADSGSGFPASAKMAPPSTAFISGSAGGEPGKVPIAKVETRQAAGSVSAADPAAHAVTEAQASGAVSAAVAVPHVQAHTKAGASAADSAAAADPPIPTQEQAHARAESAAAAVPHVKAQREAQANTANTAAADLPARAHARAAVRLFVGQGGLVSVRVWAQAPRKRAAVSAGSAERGKAQRGRVDGAVQEERTMGAAGSVGVGGRAQYLMGAWQHEPQPTPPQATPQQQQPMWAHPMLAQQQVEEMWATHHAMAHPLHAHSAHPLPPQAIHQQQRMWAHPHALQQAQEGQMHVQLRAHFLPEATYSYCPSALSAAPGAACFAMPMSVGWPIPSGSLQAAWHSALQYQGGHPAALQYQGGHAAALQYQGGHTQPQVHPTHPDALPISQHSQPSQPMQQHDTFWG
jgi:hypothetical protein